MKVKIKEGGKTKEFKLISSWSEVNLETWLKLVKFHKLDKSKEAKETIAALSDIPKKLIDKLEIKDIATILGKISELQHKQDSSLRRIIEVEGKEYGFHPDLDSITLGEYADIETFIKNDIQNHLPELCAVLYRPIVEKKNNIYTIEAYDGNISIRAEEMKKMSAEQVQNALVFFYSFAKELLMTLPSFLTHRLKEMEKQLPQNLLQKSGVGSE
tara:strand:- start:5484 stop:6125 length:642 start_codon:yes stop_codon:yes gene_type:complete